MQRVFIGKKYTSQQKSFVCFSAYKSWVWDSFFSHRINRRNDDFCCCQTRKTKLGPFQRHLPLSRRRQQDDLINKKEENNILQLLFVGTWGEWLILKSGIFHFLAGHRLFSTWFLRASFVGIFFSLSFLWCKNLVGTSACLSVGGGKSQPVFMRGRRGRMLLYYSSTKEPMLPHQRDQYIVL